MNELIRITINEQGAEVVSARELYDFLGFANSQWSRWSKKNIVNNPYGKQSEDWEGFDIMSSSNNGLTTTDYALTLDFAKRLSMLAPTEKGEEVRRYFIYCEKRASQQPPAPLPSATEQILLQLMAQSNQLLAGQQQQLDQLRGEVNQLLSSRKPSPRQPRPMAVPPTNRVLPRPLSLRAAIHQRINEYCGLHGVTQEETYNYLYKRLYDVYGISIYRLVRIGAESMLGALERYGHMDRLYALVMSELTYSEE